MSRGIECGSLLIGSIQGSPAASSGHGSLRPQGRPGMPQPFHTFPLVQQNVGRKAALQQELPGRPCPYKCGRPRGRERAPSGRCSWGHDGTPRPDPGGTGETAAGRGEVLRHLTDDSLSNKRKAIRAMLYHSLGPAHSSLRSLLSFCITLLPGVHKAAVHAGGQQELGRA